MAHDDEEAERLKEVIKKLPPEAKKSAADFMLSLNNLISECYPVCEDGVRRLTHITPEVAFESIIFQDIMNGGIDAAMTFQNVLMVLTRRTTELAALYEISIEEYLDFLSMSVMTMADDSND